MMTKWRDSTQRRLLLFSASLRIELCRGSIMGRLRACIYASVNIGDGPSVLMTLPIDMKKPNVAPEPSIYCPNVRSGP